MEMVRSVLLAVSMVLLPVLQTLCHPQCLDNLPPFIDQRLKFCTEYSSFGCCTTQSEDKVKEEYDERLKNIEWDILVSERCQGFMSAVLCQECSPFSSHMYDTETPLEGSPFPGLCLDYCLSFYDECGHLIKYITDDNSIISASQSGSEFCEYIRAADEDYCYPDILSESALTEQVTTATEHKDGCLCVEEFASELEMAIFAVHAGDGSYRIFVGEQRGIVRMYYKNGTEADEPFLDIEDKLSISKDRANGDERGIMGLAFHPNFKENGRIFLSYTNGTDGIDGGNPRDLVLTVSEIKISADDENKVDPHFERTLLVINQPAKTHIDGQLLFGPDDAFLYIFQGDGGARKAIAPLGDPWGLQGNGQNLTSFQGSVLRIDVDSESDGKPYGIPYDNPFVDTTDALPEIFAYGFRSLWRSSVDRGDRHNGEGKGRIFCGDVGHKRYEEVNLVVKGGNHGWRAKEGYTCQYTDMCTDGIMHAGDDIEPIHVYNHTIGKAIIGGYVYRGCEFPNLYGKYIFGDYHYGKLFMLTENKTSGEWNSKDICMGDESVCHNGLSGTYPRHLLSFAEDESGELYILTTSILTHNRRAGKMLKLVDPSVRGNPADCLPGLGSRLTVNTVLMTMMLVILRLSGLPNRY